MLSSYGLGHCLRKQISSVIRCVKASAGPQAKTLLAYSFRPPTVEAATQKVSVAQQAVSTFRIKHFCTNVLLSTSLNTCTAAMLCNKQYVRMGLTTNISSQIERAQRCAYALLKRVVKPYSFNRAHPQRNARKNCFAPQNSFWHGNVAEKQHSFNGTAIVYCNSLF